MEIDTTYQVRHRSSRLRPDYRRKANSPKMVGSTGSDGLIVEDTARASQAEMTTSALAAVPSLSGAEGRPAYSAIRSYGPGDWL